MTQTRQVRSGQVFRSTAARPDTYVVESVEGEWATLTRYRPGVRKASTVRIRLGLLCNPDSFLMARMQASARDYRVAP